MADEVIFIRTYLRTGAIMLDLARTERALPDLASARQAVTNARRALSSAKKVLPEAKNVSVITMGELGREIAELEGAIREYEEG
jgi:hypothetical protein